LAPSEAHAVLSTEGRASGAAVRPTLKTMLLDFMAGKPGFGMKQADADRLSSSLARFVREPRFHDETAICTHSKPIRISIVMPSYNQATFIERAILSVLNQDYPNLQFVVMDGGSTDGTVEVLRKYERRLTWRSEPDHGQSHALNKAICLADGELIGWLNSDDVYFPGALRKVDQAARRHPGAVLLSGLSAIVDESDCILQVPRIGRPSLHNLLHAGFGMASQAVFWRKEIGGATLLLNENLDFAMDFDLWLKLLNCGRGAFVPHLLGALRYYKGTKTAEHPECGFAEVHSLRARYGVDDSTAHWRRRRNLAFASNIARQMAAPHRDFSSAV
jgi:glycosyl transferase family 2